MCTILTNITFKNWKKKNIPTGVGCLSKGQRIDPFFNGRRKRQAWQTVCPQYKSLGTLSPCTVKTSSQTRHSKTYDHSILELLSFFFLNL